MMMIEKQNEESPINLHIKPINIPTPPSKMKTAFDSNIPQVQSQISSTKNKETPTDIKSIIQKHYIPIWENFEILDNIGSGSESIVNKAMHKKSKKEFALKYIKNKDEKRNLNELKIALKLKHENIIRFLSYSCSKQDKSEVILMESAKFGNLRNFQLKSLKRQVLSESLLCYFANEILKGLLFCHRNKVAHMDLKPQNVVIDDYLHAKLIDFSISVNYNDKKTSIDLLVAHFAYVFDFNYKQSLDTIKQKGYVTTLYNRFKFNNPQTKEKMEKIYNEVIKYMDSKG